MLKDVVKPLDTGDIEESMQWRKETECIDQNIVPKNIPKSHWWWYN
jgi:hypothetical protein